VLGLASRDGVAVDDGSPIDTSFPGFARLMGDLGGKVEKA
jgi:3-phosphoshikimate 1-carboxyvinyltransferase